MTRKRSLKIVPFACLRTLGLFYPLFARDFKSDSEIPNAQSTLELRGVEVCCFLLVRLSDTERAKAERRLFSLFAHFSAFKIRCLFPDF